MRSRWVGILLAIATAVATLAVPPQAVHAERRGCCGASCACDDRCPCVDRGEPTPSGESQPASPSTTRELRAGLFLAAAPIRTTSLLPASVGCDGPLGAAHDRQDDRPAGRCLLERVSRWTT